MNPIFTDYTQTSTFQLGYGQQSRIIKYVRDLIYNWFSDSRNIKDQRLLSLMYDKEGNLSSNCIKISTSFDPNKIYAGTTPAVLVSLGNISYNQLPVNMPGNQAFVNNPIQPPVSGSLLKNIPINITIVTQNHDGTVLLAQLIEMFLVMNSLTIQQDFNSLSYFGVQGVEAPKEVNAGSLGNAKQLYSSNISIVTQSYVVWTTDTQGPVFKGIKVNSNFK